MGVMQLTVVAETCSPSVHLGAVSHTVHYSQCLIIGLLRGQWGSPELYFGCVSSQIICLLSALLLGLQLHQTTKCSSDISWEDFVGGQGQFSDQMPATVCLLELQMH